MATETMQKTDADRVANGAAHLDAHFPDGWADKIDFETLDMNEWSTCIVGQLTADLKPEDFGRGFVYGSDRLSALGLDDKWLSRGFSWEIDPDLWRAEVDKRLAS